ncbi:MAG TPA: crosslink repair DNA glycosylase YcaQ family protein [Trebonia sp.]|nr:crosslink repair DNA glycosylase YcaQ family protein [Trebonia sp.]
MGESAAPVRDDQETAAGADLELSADEVRRITLYSQGFLGAGGRRGGVTGMLRRVGAVQLDTISVLARSHELVAYARLGPVGRDTVEDAYWPAKKPTTFEYWAHAACILPIADWPYYAMRRRAVTARGQRWHKVSEDTCELVLARLRDEGPLTATQLGGAKAGGPWWDWSEVKIAAEWLLDTGRAVCVRRTGWRRVYDLPERVVPKDLIDPAPTDPECLSYLVGTATRALGVATHADFIEYLRLNEYGLRLRSGPVLDEAATAAGLVPVTVPGAKRPVAAWGDPAALAWLNAGGRGTHRTALLSPFDSLIWDRKRTLRMFGYQHLFEPYVPKEKRERGYFTMPLLAGGRIVGWVDPGREGKTLLAKNVFLEKPAAVAPMARALAEAAQWVGCSNVATERVQPTALAQPLAAALRTLGF